MDEASEVSTVRGEVAPSTEPPDRERAARRFATVRVFSSPPGASRARRPTDGILLALAVLGIVALSVPAPGPTALDTATANFVATLPGLIGWFWEISYGLLLIWPLVLFAVALFAKGRKRLFLDEVLAVGIALGSAIVAGKIGGTDPSTSIHGLLQSSSPPIYLATRVALATAVVVTASPHMARPIRYMGRWFIAAGALGGIALGAALPIGVAGGLLIGFGAGALVHLLVGSPGGRLTKDQVAEALEELGVAATGVADAPLQPRGVALAVATASDGSPLLAKVFGRDAWDGQLIASTWTAIWHRGGGLHVGMGPLQQVEHEAFITLMAERGGASVMPVVAAGTSADGDALLVLRATDRTLAALAIGDVDDDLLRSCWRALGSLHELAIAHGRVDGSRIAIDTGGAAALTDFASARVGAHEIDLGADRAQLLMTTALSVGMERAVDAASRVLGPAGVAGVLPYLQTAAFDRDIKQALKGSDLSLKELRALIADRTASEIPPLEPIRRVTWSSIGKLLIAGFLAYALFSAFADVGIDTIVQEFQAADMVWLVAALVVTPFVQVPQAFSTMGATLKAVAFLPLLMLQYGVQFIALAVPSSAARVALEIRFFERVGVPAAGAVSIGMIDSLSTFTIQMLLIVVILVSGVSGLNLSSSSSSDGSTPSINWEAVVIAIALIVMALIIALLIPKTREKLGGFWKIVRAKTADAKQALQVLRQPKKLLLLFGGNLAAQVMLAIILGLCLKAFGHSATLAELILVNTFVSLFAGFMPVPGGVGVAEAGYTAGLVAIGIPSAAATSTAMAFRLVTFYIPPLWGTFAMRWMKQHEYL
jgi:uncharacterized membrane protein YbhN (UPF0104 family)